MPDSLSLVSWSHLDVDQDSQVVGNNKSGWYSLVFMLYCKVARLKLHGMA